MINDKKVIALIPARSGSKSIHDKNIISLLGKPVIAYSIEHAKSSKYIDRIIVSTDSKKYLEIAKNYGAEVPFLRPIEISDDNSLDIEVFDHALNWLKENESYMPDYCVHLRPTHPIRDPKDIDLMLELLDSRPECDSIRSIIKNTKITPYKMWFFDEKTSLLKPILIDSNIQEPYNLPRQSLPETYFQNASIDVVRTNTILEKKSMTGNNILGFLMKEEFDIDYVEDLQKVENHLLDTEFNSINQSKKRLCFDIDGIISNLTPNNDYVKATPIIDNISLINSLYEKGHKIILYTARGSSSGINWEKVTKNQLNNWGVKYHELYFGKPHADYYIDDRLININNIKKIF